MLFLLFACSHLLEHEDNEVSSREISHVEAQGPGLPSRDCDRFFLADAFTLCRQKPNWNEQLMYMAGRGSPGAVVGPLLHL